ncbi:NAD(P)/FAD-dependent oxidoreductase [Kiloniella laminariae]|uniref:Trimethylamine monooxygenase n=1 Tax=Kiloniella laminariae TaxID=454162 RepID=A0ABT4LIG1_9PROT|nr:NAD(P)/FAD-dependent oxidoreductase [Kiloniella laminariae]MCZ4280899.1 NAD(P)/FAD-dependent oxidoreductase [Kiloniella laminariae]
MIKRKTVAIIGGGISGLAAAKAFDGKGHRVIGFERSHDFGGVWELSRSYPDVQTQSPKDLYCFTDHPMPDDYPEWPKGPQVHAYLHSYADKHKLARLFHLDTNIASMDRRSDGQPGWELTLEQAGKTRTETFDFVAICTGQFSEKNILTHPGQEAFTAQGGQVIHSSEYTDPAMVRGKRVVVLGGSKSATDIVVNAAKNGAQSVTFVYREPVWRLPYFLGGINFKRLLFMRAQECQFNGWNRGLLGKTLGILLKPLIWANFRGLETLMKLQLGLKKWNMIPDVPIEKSVSCSIPIVTPGLFESFENGTVIPVQGTFERYQEDQVILSNGQAIGCDIAISAVGWKLGLPYLAQQYQDKLIDPDGQYRTFRLSVNPDLPDMGFVGFNSSFCTVLSAEMIANWLVRYADGQLQQQPSDSEMRENIELMLDWRRNERPAAQVYGGLCSAPFHYRHFDELLRDMGAKKTRRNNLLAEQFSYPAAWAYGEFLASAPQYRTE